MQTSLSGGGTRALVSGGTPDATVTYQALGAKATVTFWLPMSPPDEQAEHRTVFRLVALPFAQSSQLSPNCA
jgi:hypothetical protein